MVVSGPKPRDPRAAHVDGGAITAKVNEILAAETSTLREEAEVLSRAHDVLRGALRYSKES